ncbi:MAG: NAD-dependent deacylase [Bacteroidia bacterium]|nr:NAD-dependent deacylase [Bacteroidia bacterium]
MKNIAVLTGAGISAESGIKTFRDSDGLWENHDVMEVASVEGFLKNPELVLRFYNERRRQARACQPNPGHLALVALEEKYHVNIVTQNVDDLHEKAGSTHVLHLHGMLNKSRSIANKKIIYDIEGDISIGDKAPDGHQLRPHIVWFGEDVPLIFKAADMFEAADIVIIIGTSLAVYPASNLYTYASADCPLYVIDPNIPKLPSKRDVTYIQENASVGVPRLVTQLLAAAE